MVDVQSLVLEAKRGKRGCVEAYESLMTHYIALAHKRSANVARRNSSVDAADLESALVETAQRCYEEYDESTGPFEHFVNRSWTNATITAIRNADARNRLVEMSLDALPSGDVDNDDLRIDRRVDVEAELLADLAIVELRRRMRGEDVTLETVLVMIALGGYTHVEIARACGFEGSDEAAKMYVRRALDRIGRLIVTPGSTVRVNLLGSSLHGLEGRVVRTTKGEEERTHVVEMRDGRVLSFNANEIVVVEGE